METLKSFLIIIVVVLSFGVAVIAGQNGLLSARCAARCLTEHKASPREGRDRNDHRKFKMLDRCRQSKQCSECLKPCDAGEKQVIQEKCDLFCETSVCRRSCRFLIYIHTYKSGDCPDAETAMGFEAACLAACSIDGDCTDNQKCCPNMCGYACRAPVYTGLDLPGIPFNVTMEERRKGRSLRLKWDSPDTGENHPFGVQLYLLEQRNTTNQKAVWNHNTPWETVSMSVSRHVFIRRVHAGHWYQYRIAAVNETGTQGYSHISKPFKSSRGIQRPLLPQNITEGVTTLHRGQVDVTIHWQPPRYSDLPIWKYHLTWSERLSSISPVLVRIPVLEKMVQGHVLEFKLRRLKPGTTYHIQIEAIVQRGNRQLRSNKASKYFTTYSPRRTNPANEKTEVYSIYKDIIKVDKLQVVDDISYFDRGSLKAALSWKLAKDIKQIVKSYMIYWLPESCDQEDAKQRPYSATSDVTRFEVYDLQYECQYVIKVHAVTRAGKQGRPSTVKLSTPTCREIRVKGISLPPECPKREDQVPRSPRRVKPTILKTNCTISLNITWRHPRSDRPIESYTIRYKMSEDFKKEEEEKNTDETVSKQTPVEINLDKVTSYVISGLKPSEVYMIRISAVSSAGVGVPAFIEILTPRILPCGSDKDPEPPDTVTVQKMTVTTPAVFHSPEVSTDAGGATVTVSQTTPASSNCTTYTVLHQDAAGPNLNIYKTVYYLLFFIYKLFTQS